MESKVSRSVCLARVISKVTNPCILSVLVLLLIAYTESTKMLVFAGWVTILLLFLVLIPLIYVYMRTSRKRDGIKILADPTLFLKQHPKDILILNLVLGLGCFAILFFLEAPAILLSTLMALIASSVVTALFNIYYRVSYHLAAVTILVIMAALTWGHFFFILLAAIPLISWAKYQIHEHTPVQLAIGVALSTVVTVATSYLLD